MDDEKNPGSERCIMATGENELAEEHTRASNSTVSATVLCRGPSPSHRHRHVPLTTHTDHPPSLSPHTSIPTKSIREREACAEHASRLAAESGNEEGAVG